MVAEKLYKENCQDEALFSSRLNQQLQQQQQQQQLQLIAVRETRVQEVVQGRSSSNCSRQLRCDRAATEAWHEDAESSDAPQQTVAPDVAQPACKLYCGDMSGYAA